MAVKSSAVRTFKKWLTLGLMYHPGIEVTSSILQCKFPPISAKSVHLSVNLPPTAQEPRVIGLDDWAWKRRRGSGTLICDLEQRQPIDLLADRRVETVSAWLQTHPSIAIVSRDGSSEYASAIKKGAPQARQVSDRWLISDQRGNPVRQDNPEERKNDGCTFRTIRGITLLMVPRGRRNSGAMKGVKEAMMNLVTAEIRHISLLFPENPSDGQIGQTCFFNGFSQDGLFRLFIGFDSSRRHLYASLRNINVTKNKQALLMSDVRKSFLPGFSYDQHASFFSNQ
jgi:Transposase